MSQRRIFGTPKTTMWNRVMRHHSGRKNEQKIDLKINNNTCRNCKLHNGVPVSHSEVCMNTFTKQNSYFSRGKAKCRLCYFFGFCFFAENYSVVVCKIRSRLRYLAIEISLQNACKHPALWNFQRECTSVDVS